MSALSEPGACFVNARARALARLENRSLDKAPAGGVDVAALPLVEAINGGSQYVTTSTCAGRCAVYASPVGGGGEAARQVALQQSRGRCRGGRVEGAFRL